MWSLAVVFKHAQDQPLRSAVKRFCFGVIDFSTAKAFARYFFAGGIDVDASCSAWFYTEDVDVEDERTVGFRFEPVNVVLDVGDGGIVPRAEFAVDRWLDNHKILLIFETIVMTAMEIPFEDEEGGGHVVVTMRNDRAIFVECEDLMAEHEFGGKAFYLRQFRLQAQLAPFLRFGLLG